MMYVIELPFHVSDNAHQPRYRFLTLRAIAFINTISKLDVTKRLKVFKENENALMIFYMVKTRYIQQLSPSS